MSNVSVSIIIPIYNAAAHLERCLDAVLQQDFGDYEVICVNDGSTDDTQNILICRVSMGRDESRLRCFQQENAGAWHARLRGLSEAKGQYITFCDSDDRPATNWISTMYDRAVSTKADMTLCGYKRVDAETGRTISKEMSLSGVLDVSEDKLQLAFLNSSLWNKLFKAELLTHIYRPPQPPRLAEDALLLAGIYPHIGRVAFVPEILYDNYMHSASAMSHVSQEDFRLTRGAFSGMRMVYPPESFKLLTCIAFIHCAVSFPLLAGAEKRSAVKDTYEFLSKDFSDWKRAMTLKDVFKSKYRGKLIKIYFAFLLYRLHLFGIFLPIWQFMSNRVGIAVKW